MGKDSKYISLKEASKISGYSSDYIGQLIRSGKLPGKQVFSNVAWMTTEKDIKEYKEKNKQAQNGSGKKNRNRGSKLVKMFLYATLVFLVAFFLFLLYVFSVNLDKNLEKKALERAGDKQVNLDVYQK